MAEGLPEKFLNAPIQQPGKVYVEHDNEARTGEWMDGKQVQAFVRGLKAQRDQGRQEREKLEAERDTANSQREVHRRNNERLLDEDRTLREELVAQRERADQARQEVLEEVAAEFERRAKEQVKNEAEWVESKMAAFTYEAAAAHCRGLATLDPSGEETQVIEDRATVVLSLREANTAVTPLKVMVHTGKAVPGSPVAQVAEVLTQRIADAYGGKKPVPHPSGE